MKHIYSNVLNVFNYYCFELRYNYCLEISYDILKYATNVTITALKWVINATLKCIANTSMKCIYCYVTDTALTCATLFNEICYNC